MINLAAPGGDGAGDVGADAGTQRYSHFEILRQSNGSLDELGHGNMGTTYRARDTVLQSSVALKVISRNVADSTAVRARFLREARSAARLRHPNVASVFHYGEQEGECFYVMELVEGETLEERVRRDGPLPAAVAVEVAVQVSKALAAAEAQRLVHRDLKPSNLMLVAVPGSGGKPDETPLIKVIDFGLAKAVATDDSAMGENETRHGFVGTPAYASPEQFAGAGGSGSVDTRSDVYSLGVTLWYLLCGGTPFHGHSLEEIHRKQVGQQLSIDPLTARRVPAPVVVLFPFEWFVIRENINPIHAAPQRVLVIWLPDSLFDEEPLGRLTQVVQEIRLWQKARYSFDFAILGPVGSAMLRSMLPWKSRVAPPSTRPFQMPRGAPLSGVRMFSWSATAMDGLLMQGWESDQYRAEIKQFLRETWGLDFINTTSPDDELSAELIDELNLRGVDLSKEENHAVLLYEWDTFYGRTLPLSFAVKVREWQDDGSIGTNAQRTRKAVEEVLTSRDYGGNVTGAVSNLQAFTYLRGIDGKLAKETEKKEPLAAHSDATTTEQRKQDVAEMNRAEGQNQLDYIPRIAQELQRVEADLNHGSMGKRAPSRPLV